MVYLRAMLTFGADRAEILVYTYKEGLLSAVAHDLKLKATDFELQIEVAGPNGPNSDLAQPPASAKVTALRLRINPRSLRVICALKRGREDHGALSAENVAQVEEYIQKDVLHPDRFGSIDFAAEEVTMVTPGEHYRVQGQLSLHGRRRPIHTAVKRSGGNLVAEVFLHQPDFGIKPFRAFLGSLKLKPEVRVVVNVPAPSN